MAWPLHLSYMLYIINKLPSITFATLHKTTNTRYFVDAENMNTSVRWITGRSNEERILFYGEVNVAAAIIWQRWRTMFRRGWMQL